MMEHGTRAMSVGLGCQCEPCAAAFPDEHRPPLPDFTHRPAPPRGPDTPERRRANPKPEAPPPPRPSGPVSTKKPPKKHNPGCECRACTARHRAQVDVAYRTAAQAREAAGLPDHPQGPDLPEPLLAAVKQAGGKHAGRKTGGNSRPPKR